MTERFDILGLLTRGAIAGNIRAVTITGAPGVGKTYTVENILEHSDCNYDIIRGALSAVNLYKLGYKYRKAGSVVVLDDADSIFNDEDALNVLKALCDTSSTRKISWMKESLALKDADSGEMVDRQYEFEGTMMFISNLDFQTFVEEGKNKYAQHFEALMSRSLYLDLRLHTRAELGVWTEHVARTGKVFEREDVPVPLREPILAFLRTHRENLRELSIRTLMKLCQMAKSHPKDWDRIARVLLVKC